MEAKVASTSRLLHKHGNRDWHWITDAHRKEGVAAHFGEITWVGLWTQEQKDKYNETQGNGKPEGKENTSSGKRTTARESAGSNPASFSSRYVLKRIRGSAGSE